eukprot:g2117.t1
MKKVLVLTALLLSVATASEDQGRLQKLLQDAGIDVGGSAESRSSSSSSSSAFLDRLLGLAMPLQAIDIEEWHSAWQHATFPFVVRNATQSVWSGAGPLSCTDITATYAEKELWFQDHSAPDSDSELPRCTKVGTAAGQMASCGGQPPTLSRVPVPAAESSKPAYFTAQSHTDSAALLYEDLMRAGLHERPPLYLESVSLDISCDHIVREIIRDGTVRMPPVANYSFLYHGDIFSGTFLHQHGSACAWSSAPKLWMFMSPEQYCALPSDGDNEITPRCSSARIGTRECVEGVHPLDFLQHIDRLLEGGIAPTFHVQQKGDLFCFPEGWYHGTVNLAPTTTLSFVRDVSSPTMACDDEVAFASDGASHDHTFASGDEGDDSTFASDGDDDDGGGDSTFANENDEDDFTFANDNDEEEAASLEAFGEYMAQGMGETEYIVEVDAAEEANDDGTVDPLPDDGDPAKFYLDKAFAPFYSQQEALACRYLEKAKDAILSTQHDEELEYEIFSWHARTARALVVAQRCSDANELRFDRALKDLMDKFPGSVEGAYLAGAAASRRGDHLGAAQHFQAVLKPMLNPDAATAADGKVGTKMLHDMEFPTIVVSNAILALRRAGLSANASDLYARAADEMRAPPVWESVEQSPPFYTHHGSQVQPEFLDMDALPWLQQLRGLVSKSRAALVQLSQHSHAEDTASPPPPPPPSVTLAPIICNGPGRVVSVATVMHRGQWDESICDAHLHLCNFLTETMAVSGAQRNAQPPGAVEIVRMPAGSASSVFRSISNEVGIAMFTLSGAAQLTVGGAAARPLTIAAPSVFDSSFMHSVSVGDDGDWVALLVPFWRRDMVLQPYSSFENGAPASNVEW